MTSKEKLTRRKFLKITVGLGEGLVLAACGIRKSKYEVVSNGRKVNLVLPGKTVSQPVTFLYSHANEAIYLRKDGIIAAFLSGSTAEKYVGELAGTKIQKLVRNPDIPSDITIGIWRTPWAAVSMNDRIGEIDSDECVSFTDGTEYPSGQQKFGLQIVTGYDDLLEDSDNPAPFELNPHYSEITGNYADTQKFFGIGWAVGTLKDDQFTIDGFIPDSRVLKPID